MTTISAPDDFYAHGKVEHYDPKEMEPDGPIPLFQPLPPAQPYPLDALGPLKKATLAIAHKVQVPAAIAAQSTLAVAALACQAHGDVMLPYGQTRPLSLIFVTVAASGDRKSTADNEALWPIRKREKHLRDEEEVFLESYFIELAAHQAEKRRIENDKKMDFQRRKQALRDLGPEPRRPLYPFLTAPDPTVEGMVKAWATAQPALGIFTAEGGQFIGGHGMSADNRLKTAATLSEIWDGHAIKRLRAGDGVSILHGRRLSMHLMVQHEAANQFLSDSMLRDQGLLSRVLVAAPESIAGTRFYRDSSPADDADIKAYGARILSILEAPLPLAEGKDNELEPRTLTLSPAATAAWRHFYDDVERRCGEGNELRDVQDFAAKSAEHAARLAGVLTLVDDINATEISAPIMDNALTLLGWYLGESLRLLRAARVDPKLTKAQRLLDWLQTRPNNEASFREITRLGPNPVRSKDAANEAITILEAHGHITQTGPKPRRIHAVTA